MILENHMSEGEIRDADDANDYLRTEGIFRIRQVRDELENLRELLKLYGGESNTITVRPRVQLPDFEAA